MSGQKSDENPFAAPTVQSNPATNVSRPTFGWLIFFWMLMFCVNLPLPVMFGLQVTAIPAQAGMIVGCMIVSVTGLWLCRVSPDFMLRLSIGAVPTALSQFFGVLHILVGMAAIVVSRWIFHPFKEIPPGNMTGIDEVTVATVLTGIGLILPSIAIGYVAGVLFGLPAASGRHRKA